MVAVQIRDVPQATRDALAAEAERRGQSLQIFLADILEREAASARNLARVAEMRKRPPMFDPASLDIVEIIRTGREDRDQQILEAITGRGR